MDDVDFWDEQRVMINFLESKGYECEQAYSGEGTSARFFVRAGESDDSKDEIFTVVSTLVSEMSSFEYGAGHCGPDAPIEFEIFDIEKE
jgi:hypothetical protein